MLRVFGGLLLGDAGVEECECVVDACEFSPLVCDSWFASFASGDEDVLVCACWVAAGCESACYDESCASYGCDHDVVRPQVAVCVCEVFLCASY